MSSSRLLIRIAVAGVIISWVSMVYAQSYPRKAVRIVTAEAGGGSDFTARYLAQLLTASLGQQVIVENRASGVIPGDIVAKATADGHTLLLYNNILWIGPLMQRAPYDAERDFAPITLIGRTPSILVVNASMAVQSVADLVALAMVKPGELNYASTGAGASNRLAAELFKSMARVNLVRINYKGGGMALNGLIGGEVQLMFTTAVTGAPHVKSGKVKVLGVTSAQPSALAPGVPTLADSGLPGYEATTFAAIFAPAKTPKLVLDKLHGEIVRHLHRADVRERFFSTGLEIVGSSPDQLAAAIKSDIAKLGRVIKDAGIRTE